MATEMKNDDFQALWQDQPVEPLRMAVEELRSRATGFQARIRARNRREYIAGAFVVVVNLVGLWSAPSLWTRTSCALAIAASVVVAWFIHRRGGSATVPEDLGAQDCVRFHRNELERQRQLLDGVWRWYLGPFVPPAVVAVAARFHDRPEALWGNVGIATGLVGVFCGVAWLNARAAAKLAREIEHLDNMERQQ